MLPAAPRIRRMIAAAIDLGLGAVFMIPIAAPPVWMAPFMEENFIAKMIRFVPALYLLLRDSLGGRSLGKVVTGLVTYDRNLEHPGNIVDSVVRNWPFALALIPMVGWFATAACAFVMAFQILIGRAQRFGDGFATTQVVDASLLPAG